MEKEDTTERDLLKDIDGLYERYHQLLQQNQQIYPVLLQALAELSIQRSTTDRLAAPSVNALPIVPKKVEVGPRGGVRYINSKGNIIWLKKSQKAKCVRGTLEGAAAGSCPTPPSPSE